MNDVIYVIAICIVLFMIVVALFNMFMPDDKDTLTIPRQDFNKAVNQAYLRGYDVGYDTGKLDALVTTVTPDEIRKAFGFDVINKEDSNEHTIHKR